MPFRNFASKFMLIVVSLLVHNVLFARCAPPGPLPDAKAPSALPVNPASNNISSGASTTSKSSQLDLLDKTKLPFLDGCDADTVSRKLCELYGTLTAGLIQRKPEPASVDEVKKAITEEVDANRFCDNLVPVLKNINAKHPDVVAESPLERETVCNRWCVEMNEDMTVAVEVKPICKVLLWGFKQELASEQEETAQDPVKNVANAILPPLLNEDDQTLAVQKKDAAPPAAGVATQPNATEAEKAVQVPAVAKPDVADESKKVTVPEQKAVVDLADAAAGKPQATTSNAATASSIQPKVTPADKIPPVEDDMQDSNEEQNQDNINALNNNDGSMANPADPEEYSEDDDDFEPQSIGPKDSAVKDGPRPGHDLAHDKDSDGSSVDQPAAAAVQIEQIVDPFYGQDDSNFFSYFLFMMFACIACYVAYHNKSKLFALVVEGKRSSSGRGGFSKGRKHTAAYRKLDSNLEEAITSNASASSRSTSQIIY